MKKISEYLKLASGAFAVVPGMAVLLSSVGVPPNSSATLFGATIEALGIITLMILWLNRKWIMEKSIRTITRISIICVVVFIIALFSYIFFYGGYVIGYADSQPVFFPLWAQGELEEGLKTFGSKAELMKNWGRDDVYKVIQETSNTPLLFTKLIFLFVYQLIFISLTFGFGLTAIKTSTLGEDTDIS